MIRRCGEHEVDVILEIINDAASAYRGAIPAERWTEPYMAEAELRREIDAGVVFWGYYDERQLVGAMGIQNVQDVTLIRHAYVRTARRREGIGGRLLESLRDQSSRPYLIGTWAAATWAVRFYEKHGFRLLPSQDATDALRKYWDVPESQIETSVVLADSRWQPEGDESGRPEAG